ncbi:hypothetical protein EJ05DRAFT_479046 [Pseudovirgaria hyperparasitica]|uniref:NADH dehydrogenase [ubiquinone] 1 alpha subcomplex assembly factor 3 n=1 Tax=Pseudovirgaria hyperparasitica TaxID=470096 RepID=A0A6A6VYB4_9PEZI|nr:uncharacterized protein EJ05DRAFT_479046 [Pseudovirgaria hyperparasitica]KAF2755253.1 hypothetical protein EJ05DRAFT_479046 [Pseudovirgaria hyperparasitica]
MASFSYNAAHTLRAVVSRPSLFLGGHHHQIRPTRPYRCLSCRSKLIAHQYPSSQCARHLHGSLIRAAEPPKSRYRGPESKEETQTDFADMNILRNTPTPASSIDACTTDGFRLSSGEQIKDSGVLLVHGQAFNWRPWTREIENGTVADIQSGSETLRNAKGLWEVRKDAWGLLEMVWPKPDLLIIGTGPNVMPISPRTRKHINDLGIRIEVSDTRNAAAQYNLLATERGLQEIAAAIIPIGWKEGR